MNKPSKKKKTMLNLNDRLEFNEKIASLVSTSGMNYLDAIFSLNSNLSFKLSIVFFFLEGLFIQDFS
jgi:hypothetical protein